MRIIHDNAILVEPQAKAKFTVGLAPKANPLASGNVIVIGESEGGEPETLMWFTDKLGAKDVLRSGDALQAIGYIFNPSGQEQGAPNVGFVRAQTALQGELDIGSVIIKSLDYGTWVNNIQIKVETGTESDTNKLSVQYGDYLESWDNLGLAVSIQYTGSETEAKIEVTAADHIIGTNGDTGTENTSFDFNLALADYDTLSKLVAKIAEVDDWTCTLYEFLPAGASALASTVLDTLAAAVCKSAELHLQAYPDIVVHTVNAESALVEAELEDQDTAVTNTTGFENLASGASPSMTNDNIATVLTAIEEANCQIIYIDSTTESQHALVTAHCIANDYWRQGVFGGVSQTTKALAISDSSEKAKNMNSAYGCLVACGVWDVAVDGSGTELLVPKFFAAKVAGLIAGQPVIEPITHKVFSCTGLQYDFTKSEREQLINGGVIAPRDYEGVGYLINQGINTLQSNTNLWDVGANASPEISLMRAQGQFNRELAVAAERIFIGGTVGVGRGTIESFVTQFCNDKEKDGTLAANDADPDNYLAAWENLVITRLDAGWSVAVSLRFNNPFNFFLIESIAIL